MHGKTRRRLLINLVLALAISSLLSLGLVYDALRPLQLLQLKSSDLLFTLKEDAPSRWAVLVAIDDRTAAELRSSGRVFSWSRQFHARVIDNLKAAGARIIVFDILFDAPAEGDAELATSIREAGNVVLAEAGDPTRRLPPTEEHNIRFASTIEQLPLFREGALAIGHANQDPDDDGTLRSTPLLIQVDEQDFPSLPLVAAAKFLRRPQVIEAPIQSFRLPFAGRDIPLDERRRMWISYLGDSSEVALRPTFPVLSFVDVMNNSFDPAVVRGKAAFLGVTATGFADDYWTPVSRVSKMDGVEVHANAFETITNVRPGQFVVPATTELTIGLIFLASLIPVVVLTFLSPLPAAVVCTLTAGAYLAFGVLALDWKVLLLEPDVPGVRELLELLRESRPPGLLLDMPFPLLSQAFSFLGILMYRVVFEQAQQRALKGAMAQYLSPDVMEEVVRDPSAIKLGGDKREMTVLFSDIRGFTSLSESLDPEKLVLLLNVYLTRMSDVIFKHQGTVDKYMGDAIMAFWGAPKPQADHARRACLAALEMVEELEKLNQEFEREGIPRLNIGIGLNTGLMSVGNMGSERRFDYTVMGDSVNLGARLEGLNKEYGTNVIASETTLARAGEDIRARFLDLVAVKGKKEPARVFELLSSNGVVDPKAQAALNAYQEGVECYRHGKYEAAIPCFEQALALNDHDGASALYIERCKELLANPPPADWDGVFVMTHK